ncbi:MAG: hypothetical protein U5K71_14105 [Gracilimonas sp.]|nr:hypothetical protein [Gracilimonas sp.]
MKRIVHIAKNHKEAREWDIKQSTSMTPAERQAIAKELKNRVYGKEVPDVRQAVVIKSK